MTRIVAAISMAASGVVLAVYQALGERQRQEADRLTAEAAKSLYHLALGQLPIGQPSRLPDFIRHRN